MIRCSALCGLSVFLPLSFSALGPTELLCLLSPLWSVLPSLTLVFLDLDPWEEGLVRSFVEYPHVGFASCFLRIRWVDGLLGGNPQRPRALVPLSGGL